MSKQWPMDTTNDKGDDVLICRCEEVTQGEIKAALRNGMCSVSGVKRATRAGMGLCQGLSCGRQVARIVGQETKENPGDLEPITARPPARPIPMYALARDGFSKNTEGE